MWFFVQAMLIETTLFKQDPEEGKSKAKKILVQGNLNSSFFFCVLKRILILWFFEYPCKIDSWQYFPQAFEPQISDCTRKYTYVQRFWRLLKENHV